jgi:protein subunit release factor A
LKTGFRSKTRRFSKRSCSIYEFPISKQKLKNHTESLLYLNELSENVAKESDAEMKELLREEIRETEEQIGEIEEEVFDVLAEYETEEAEKTNFVVQAGADGDEARNIF